jgi:hypothetical protein
VPSTLLSRCRSTDTTALALYTDGLSDHSVLKDSSPNLTVRIFETIGWTAAPPSVHPVLKLQSWHVSVLIQTERRIDQRCPHLDHRFIRCYRLRCFSSAIHPTHLETGLSDHLTVSTSFCLLRSLLSAPTLLPRVPSDHPTVSFSFLFFASSTCLCFNLTYLTCNHL